MRARSRHIAGQSGFAYPVGKPGYLTVAVHGGCVEKPNGGGREGENGGKLYKPHMTTRKITHTEINTVSAKTIL